MGKFLVVLLFLVVIGVLYLSPKLELKEPPTAAADLARMETLWREAEGLPALFHADNLAAFHFSRGAVEEAIWYVDWVSERFPTLLGYELAAHGYGRAYQATEEGSERQRHYASKARYYHGLVLAHCPEDVRTMIDLALAYLPSRQPMRGVALLKEVLREDPEQPDALYHLGLLSFRTGQYGKAIDYLGRLVDCRPSDVRALFHLGHAYIMDGQPEQGRAYWRRAGVEGASFVDEALRSVGQKI